MPRRKKKKRRKLAPAEAALRRNQRQFRKRIQDVFRTAGFKAVSTRGKSIVFKDRQGEFDSIFLFENILVVVEDTCLRSSEEIYNHVLRKDRFYDHLRQNKDEFVEYLKETFEEIRNGFRPEFETADVILI